MKYKKKKTSKTQLYALYVGKYVHVCIWIR